MPPRSVLVAVVAAAPWWSAAARCGAELPPIACVEALRQARIERGSGDLEPARKRIEAVVDLPGCQVPALAALLELLQQGAYPPAGVAELRGRLAGLIEDPAIALPAGIVGYLAHAPTAAAQDELLAGALARRLERARAAGATLAAREESELLAALVALELRLDRWPEARATVARLLALEDAETWRWQALDLDLRLERWADVAADVEVLLSRPGAAELLRGIYVVALARLGRYDEMLTQIGLLTALPPAQGAGDAAAPADLPEPGHVALLLEAGWALRDAGRAAEAETLFRRALALAPDHREAQLVLLHFYASSAERAAQEAAVAERRAQEGDPHALFEEGSQLLAAGDLGTARELLARAAPALAGTTYADAAWYNLGLAAYKLERWAEAAAASGRPAELDPGRVDTFYQRGLALFHLERWAEAAAALRRALELAPDRHNAHYYLSKCYLALGDAAAAEREAALYRRRPGAG